MFRGRRYDNDSGSRSFAPINVGDELDVTIEAQGEKGDGLAKVKGFVIFVPGAKQGERVKVKINKVLKKVGFAEVVGKATSEETKEESSETTEGEKTKEESSETTESENTEEEQDYDEASEDSEDFGEES